MKTGFWAIVLAFLAIACQPALEPRLDLGEATNHSELFGEGIVSSQLYERDFAVAPGGDEIIYTLGNFTQTFRCLVSIRHENGQWGEPEILPFSGSHNDIEPFFAPDGKALFFASNRPIDSLNAPKRSDYNIWYVERNASGWGRPMALDTVINTAGDEFYPSVSKNKSLYFTAQRKAGPGKEDIYLSRFTEDGYQAAVALDTAVNSGTYEFNAYVSPNEDIIVFSSYGRPDDMGGGDLYFSIKNKEGNWLPSKNMGPKVNSDALDYCPFIDLQRNTFYFTSNRAAPFPGKMNSVDGFRREANSILNGMGNIYRIRTEALDLPRKVRQ